MTVCVAAIADNGGTVFAAADRMLTKQDIQYEPEAMPKLKGLGQQGLVLLAGNMSVHSEIAAAFAKEVSNDQGVPEGLAVRTLEEYARLFADLYAKRAERLRERTVLGARNLTMEAYLANQSRMHEVTVRQIDRDLSQFQLPDSDAIEAIFAGKDKTGTHIFTVHNDYVVCHDLPGYAVIGSGYNIADSQFIFAKHSPNTPSPKAMYTLHRAKRMAEQSSGVGHESDWYVIVQIAAPLHDDLLKLLEKMYRQERNQETKRFSVAERQIKADIAKRVQPAPAQSALTSAPSTVPPQPSGQSVPASPGSGSEPAPAPR